jgi:uncharacterized protein (DUF1501 family)
MSNTTNNGYTRRQFIQLASTGIAALSFPGITSASMLSNTPASSPKIVWILLRGALDSLHTVIPSFDKHYPTLRPSLSQSFTSPVLPLDRGFSLHPAMSNMHRLFKTKQLIPVVAVSSGYQRRSHFDGQDFLESGKGIIDHDSGWLARAIDVKHKKALSISRATPISLRSSSKVNTWFPTRLNDADNDIYLALEKLYQDDELLSMHLNKGLALKGIVNSEGNKKGRLGKFEDLTKDCAKLLTSSDNVDCAMLELGGWDTHNQQASRLNQKLAELDTGIDVLRKGMGRQWSNTVVIIATEFGRTVRENGTKGTDHGTGNAMFLAGGSLKGGMVKGQWPGLADEQLYENRDLMPTTNTFGWIGSILQQHWGFTDEELAIVFPQVDSYKESLLI